MKNPISTDHLLPCMDYLHGYVSEDELEAACYYEYARESEMAPITVTVRSGESLNLYCDVASFFRAKMDSQTPVKPRCTVYIDGFNFYYGVFQDQPQWKWQRPEEWTDKPGS